MAQVFVPKERAEGETRVAASPETVKRLVKEGFEVLVETGAGRRASFVDSQYEAAGAKVVSGDAIKAGWGTADVVVKVAPVGPNETVGHEADAMKEGAILISFANPHKELEGIAKLRDRKVSALSMELVPRISRAQSMDALSSQASIGGYKAVLLAATKLDKYCPLLMTAAGTIQPARFVIMGAGVAGLQAIATARRLGAIVEVSDIRPAVKEQIESLGAKFIDFPMDESGRGQGRLRAADVGGRRAAEGPAGRGARAREGSRRGHHHGARPRSPGPAPDHRRDGGRDARGRGHHRHGHRGGRQLRADGVRRGGREERRDHRRRTPTSPPPCRTTRA